MNSPSRMILGKFRHPGYLTLAYCLSRVENKHDDRVHAASAERSGTSLSAWSLNLPAAYQARGLRVKKVGLSTTNLSLTEKEVGPQDLKLGRQNQISGQQPHELISPVSGPPEQ